MAGQSFPTLEEIYNSLKRGMKTMKKILIHFIVIAVCVFVFSSPVMAAKSPPLKEAILPEINLAVPVQDSDRNYLGIPTSGFFKIPQIKARVVLIEIFSMYCPHCQDDARNVNKLYT
jgi:protein-disulfide isomerase